MRLSKAENSRLLEMSSFEIRLRSHGVKCVAGIDEVGRGSLAGPVVAAACVLPENFLLKNLNDSKLLSEKERESLFTSLTSDAKVRFGIGIVEAPDIDRINILQATFLAMQRAVGSLSETPDYLLVDGDKLPRTSIKGEAIVRGDRRSVSIAAASIIAKVTRDRLLTLLDDIYPLYGLKKNKGYGTEEHIKAIKLHGPCLIHRKTFDPIKSLLELSLF